MGLFNAFLQFIRALCLFLQKIHLKSKLLFFVKTIFPSTLTEAVVFLFFLVAYGILGTYIASNFRIIFDDRIPWDAYFSFDNRSIVLTGGGVERHPLANYFFDFIRKLALYISDGKKDADFRLALAWFSNIAVSLSIVQVFKYLKNIIKLPLFLSVLLVALFGMFSTNILLSFTPETYTFSLFLLMMFNYYSALKLRNNQPINGIALGVTAVSVGGLTITNIVKVFIPVLFEDQLFRSWRKFWSATLKVGLSVIAFVLLYLNRINFNYHLIFSKTGEQYEKFSQPKVTPLWDMIFSWFFGGNMLFSSFVTRDYHNKKGFEYKALFMDVYSSWVPYAVVFIILALIIWSCFKNFKNKLVQILAISLLFDVVIHCVLKFGLHTSYIYGGHFVYVYPLLIGWLLYAYRQNGRVLSFLTCTITVVFVYLTVNNLYRLNEFFDFLIRYYQ